MNDAPYQPLFYYVDDGVPPRTTELLQLACAARGVAFVPVDPHGFDFRPERQLRGGELLYRPAVSRTALCVEQFLYADGVATFYRHSRDLFFDCLTPYLWYQRAGLPIPRTIRCTTADRTLLREFTRQLGGLPLILKVPGFEGGIGVMRADSFPALFSLVDFALHQGYRPLLSAYVPDAVHWRLVVLGEDVVAAYRNGQAEDDFRSHVPSKDTFTPESIPPRMEDLAVRATHLRGSEFGGVDVLEHVSGRLYLLEANFPCYFPHAQELTGVDIAGRMVDFLLTKAARLRQVRCSAA